MAKFRQYSLESIDTSAVGKVPQQKFRFSKIIVPADEANWSMITLLRYGQPDQGVKVEYVKFDVAGGKFAEGDVGGLDVLAGIGEQVKEFSSAIVAAVRQAQVEEKLAEQKKKAATTDMTRVHFRANHIMIRMVDAVRDGDKGLLIELGKKYMATAQNWVANLNAMAGVTPADIEAFYMAQVENETGIKLDPEPKLDTGTVVPQPGKTVEEWRSAFASKDPVVAQLQALPSAAVGVDAAAATPAATPAAIEAALDNGGAQALKQAETVGCTCEAEGEMQLCPIHHPNLQSFATVPMSEAAEIAHFEEPVGKAGLNLDFDSTDGSLI